MARGGMLLLADDHTQYRPGVAMAGQTLAEFLQELQKDGGAVVSASDEIADNNFD